MIAATRPAPASDQLRGGRRGLGMFRRRRGDYIGEGGLSHCDNAGQSNCGKDGTEHLISPVLAYQAGEFDGSNVSRPVRRLYEALHTLECRCARGEIDQAPNQKITQDLDRSNRRTDALRAARLGQGAAMDVADWLRDLGLERYEATFRENDVNAEVLPISPPKISRDLALPPSAIGGGFWWQSPRCAPKAPPAGDPARQPTSPSRGSRLALRPLPNAARSA